MPKGNSIKILHCADLHLDSKMSFLPPEKAEERRAELLETLIRLADYAEQAGASAVLIAGDLFDRRQISAAARDAVYDVICGHPEIAFFYLTGNHEHDGFLRAIGNLPDNLKTFQGNDMWTLWNMGPVTVAGADLTGQEEHALSMLPSLRPDRFNIVLLHGQTREYPVKGAAVIDLSALRNRNIDYLALGHVHAHQLGRLDSRGIWCYPGCLEGRGYDECRVHGFEELEIDGESGRVHVRFVPFARRMTAEVPVDVTGCMTSDQAERRIRETLESFPGLSNAPARQTDGYRLYDRSLTQKDMVRIVLQGTVDVDASLSAELLRKVFEGQYYDLRIDNQTRPFIDARLYEHDATLKGAFVRLVEGEKDLSEERKAEIIRCGIRALSGEVDSV